MREKIQKWLFLISKECDVLLSCIAPLPLALGVRRERFIARLRVSYTMVFVDQRKKQLADVCCYFLPVSEIGRYLSWLFSSTARVLCNTPRLFVSRGLLLGFGELLSCKKDCHCRFVVTCVRFTANCQKWSHSKSLRPRFFCMLLFYMTWWTQKNIKSLAPFKLRSCCCE